MKHIWFRIILFIIFLFFFPLLIVGDSSWLRIDGEVASTYNFASIGDEVRGVDMDFAFFVGLRTREFSRGMELAGGFQFLDLNSSINGYNFNLGGYYKGYYRISSLLEWQWGGGFLWQHENFREISEPYIADLWGPSFFNTVRVNFSLPYLSMEFSGKVDLLFSFNDDLSWKLMSPYFTGGLRVIYTPLPGKLDIFLDFNPLIWSFDDQSLVMDPWVFQAGGGIAWNFEPTEIIETIRLNRARPGKRLNSGNSIDLIDAPPEIIALIKGKAGDVIAFHNIRFPGSQEDLTEESITVLDSVAEALRKREDLGVFISAYAEAQGDPEKEFELALRRAEVIREYFLSLGFDPGRIRQGTSGGLAFTEETMIITLELFENLKKDDFSSGKADQF